MHRSLWGVLLAAGMIPVSAGCVVPTGAGVWTQLDIRDADTAEPLADCLVAERYALRPVGPSRDISPVHTRSFGEESADESIEIRPMKAGDPVDLPPLWMIRLPCADLQESRKLVVHSRGYIPRELEQAELGREPDGTTKVLMRRADPGEFADAWLAGMRSLPMAFARPGALRRRWLSEARALLEPFASGSTETPDPSNRAAAQRIAGLLGWWLEYSDDEVPRVRKRR
jgi:hypothetical protein